MLSPSSPPQRASQTPTTRWFVYVLLLPWLQLLTGVTLIVFAKSAPDPLSLFEGATISLYTVGLLAGTVCAFGSPTPPPVSSKVKRGTEVAFHVVVFFSVIFVVLTQTGNVISSQNFLLFQALLLLVAIPFSWAART